MNSYRQILQDWTRAGHAYAVIGTFGLQLRYPQAEFLQPGDCDLVLPFDLVQINVMAEDLLFRGWELRLWDETVETPLSADRLAGRFYLRAVYRDQTLDMTFECPWIEWEQMMAQSNLHAHIRVASTAHILHLKEVRGRADDLDFNARFRDWLQGQQL